MYVSESICLDAYVAKSANVVLSSFRLLGSRMHFGDPSSMHIVWEQEIMLVSVPSTVAFKDIHIMFGSKK